jgi:hypothetical protein
LVKNGVDFQNACGAGLILNAERSDRAVRVGAFMGIKGILQDRENEK